MSTPDGQVLIAYNGETYNAFDLRPDLEAKGHEFHSNTDTEVLLHLYLEHGIGGMLERMNGMFALCIVDVSVDGESLDEFLAFSSTAWDGFLLGGGSTVAARALAANQRRRRVTTPVLVDT